MQMQKKLKVTLIGYGKMGKAVAGMLRSRQHQIATIIDHEDDWDIKRDQLAESDVAIEFTTPEAAPDNVMRCFKLDVPVVTGTTGWLDKMTPTVNYCKKHEHTLFYASNFSIGVNIFFELNARLAGMLAGAEGYKPAISETHHTQKLDAPSGTAITLAKDIISRRDNLSKWGNADEHLEANALPIKSHRVDKVTGTHVVTYDSLIDSIEIKHTAHNRSGFAEGAVLAAEWVHDKRGVFGMKHLLNI